MVKNIAVSFAASTLGLLAANALFHTSQLPEGPLPYWVAGGLFAWWLLRHGAAVMDQWSTRWRALRASSFAHGRKNYASEYTFKGEADHAR